jgi:putative transposase
LDRAQEIGLFRWKIVGEATDLSLSARERGRLVRALAEREHLDPDGRWVRVTRTTLDRWIRAYRQGGFDALVPAPRRPAKGMPERLELAVALRSEQPARTAAQIHRIIVEAEGAAPSARTIQRHLKATGLPWKSSAVARALGRFEAEKPNELWTGDALHGPLVDGRRTFLFCFLDDHSRLLVGYRWAAREDVLNASGALRAGIAARGIPKAVYVDFVPRNKIDVLFPRRLCARQLLLAGDHGDRQRLRLARGHITVRARRASSAASRRSAKLAWCGIPPKHLIAR